MELEFADFGAHRTVQDFLISMSIIIYPNRKPHHIQGPVRTGHNPVAIIAPGSPTRTPFSALTPDLWPRQRDMYSCFTTYQVLLGSPYWQITDILIYNQTLWYVDHVLIWYLLVKYLLLSAHSEAAVFAGRPPWLTCRYSIQVPNLYTKTRLLITIASISPTPHAIKSDKQSLIVMLDLPLQNSRFKIQASNFFKADTT